MATQCCVLILGIRFSAPQAYQKLVLPFTEKQYNDIFTILCAIVFSYGVNLLKKQPIIVAITVLLIYSQLTV